MVNTKQRAFLKSLANGIETIFQVGKSAVTPDLVSAIDAALEKRELIKIGILNNCMMDIREVADIISERTQSETVQIIGKKIIIFRQSKTNKVIELP
ncbi:MAG: ribosome assembly RNA-binding protein YhbY [Clostridiales bacterium]|nr:ribosome assembly RNA-binding protein YhbY [Clostridiales bacterium]